LHGCVTAQCRIEKNRCYPLVSDPFRPNDKEPSTINGKERGSKNICFKEMRLKFPGKWGVALE
jgi:hypothetical protein